MKKLFSLLLAALLLVSALPTAAFAADTDYRGKTVILYTGNLRGDVDVYAKVKAVKDDYEKAGADVVLVDAGNYLQGSAAANTDRGLSIYNLMDAVGYDVAAMGLGEFSYTDAATGYIYHGNVTKYHTQAQLQKGTEAVAYNKDAKGAETAELAAKEAAKFQTVASNVTTLKEDAYAFEASATVTTKSGLKVGFYGVTDRAVENNVQKDYVKVGAPAQVKVDADVVVCLSNMEGTAAAEGTILIEAPTGGGEVVGAYVIDNETRAATKEDVKLDKADEAVAALAKEARENAAKVVGASAVILNGSDAVGWNRETNLGDLVTDALVWYAENYVDGLNKDLPLVAIQNGGNCDSFIYPGDITETDLLKALPFSPMGVGVLEVTGAQLLEAIEAATQKEDHPGFAQVSGLKYTLDTTVDYDGGKAFGNYFVADSINRVTITEVGGKPFDPEATYALVCDNFLMNGNDGYYVTQNAKEAEGAKYINNGSGVKVRDAVAMYIDKVLDGAVGETYAKPQGRITVVSFSDATPDHTFFNEVAWAVEQKITAGTSKTTFSPNDDCTQVQILTFLWRAKGKPASTVTAFSNLAGDYAPAANWAYETGMIDDSFNPNAACTRAQAVSYIWQACGGPETAPAAFTDVPADADYAQAVAWAAEKRITTGTTETTFTPGRVCNRGEIVAFLYRCMG